MIYWFILRTTGSRRFRWAGDSKRNLIASDVGGDGDVDAVIADCDEVLENRYHMRAFNQAMMETFRTYTHLDRYGRLHVISSTQIVFPCTSYFVKSAWHSKEQDQSGKTTYRRRIWSKADSGK